MNLLLDYMIFCRLLLVEIFKDGIGFSEFCERLMLVSMLGNLNIQRLIIKQL